MTEPIRASRITATGEVVPVRAPSGPMQAPSMPGADAGAASTRGAATRGAAFHVSLNVSSLDASIAFYKNLLGVAPVLCENDYAAFELSDPPLALSLQAGPRPAGGALNHLGLGVNAALEALNIQHRLASAGIAVYRPDGVKFRSRQGQFWVDDPDRNHWEIYVLASPIEGHAPALAGGGNGSPNPPAPPRSSAAFTGLPATASQAMPAAQALAAPVSAAPISAAPISSGPGSGAPMSMLGPPPAGHAKSAPPTPSEFRHRLGEPFPAAIAIDHTLELVTLQGTFNERLEAVEELRILATSRRALREGGRIAIHGLAADAQLADPAPKLPGPAGVVRHVPTANHLLDLLKSAGFSSIRLAKLSPVPLIRCEDIALREIMIEGQVENISARMMPSVRYQGLLNDVTDELGNRFVRGVRTPVSPSVVQALRAGPLAASFAFFAPGEA